MLAHGFGDRHEDHAGLGQLFLEGGDHRDRIEHGVDGNLRLLDACQDFLLAQRNAELLVDAQQFRIDIVDRLRTGNALGRRVIMDVLEIDLRVVDTRPCRLFQRQPALERIQPPLEHPFGLVLLGRNHPDGVFVETLRRGIAVDDGLETVFVLVHVDLTDLIDGLLHCRHGALQSRRVKAGSLLTSCDVPFVAHHYVGRDGCPRYVIREKFSLAKRILSGRIRRPRQLPFGQADGY
jgi:hypothetical protein